MYKECAEGNIYSEWKIHPKKVMDYHTFGDRLSTPGLEYSPVFQRYPADRARRVSTKLSQFEGSTENVSRRGDSSAKEGRPAFECIDLKYDPPEQFKMPNEIEPSQGFVEILAIFHPM